MKTITLCTETDTIRTRCEMVLKHKWDEAHLVALSKRGKQFVAAHRGETILVKVTPEWRNSGWWGALPLRLTEVTETEAG